MCGGRGNLPSIREISALSFSLVNIKLLLKIKPWKNLQVGWTDLKTTGWGRGLNLKLWNQRDLGSNWKLWHSPQSGPWSNYLTTTSLYFFILQCNDYFDLRRHIKCANITNDVVRITRVFYSVSNYWKIFLLILTLRTALFMLLYIIWYQYFKNYTYLLAWRNFIHFILSLLL